MNPVWFNELRIVREYENEGIVASLPDPGVTLNLYNGSEYCGIQIWEDTVSAQDVKRLKAKKFVELIMQGKTPTKAAKEINEHLSRFQNREETQIAIRQVIENWTFDPKVRKLYSRAKLMEILATQDVNDSKSAKVALEAIKLIGSDDEVGYLNSKVPPPPPSGVQVPEALQKLLGIGPAENEEVVDGDVSEE